MLVTDRRQQDLLSATLAAAARRSRELGKLSSRDAIAGAYRDGHGAMAREGSERTIMRSMYW